MAKTPDFTKPFQDMMQNFPVDTSSMTEAFKTQSQLGEKMTRVALQAAERSTEISAAWAKDTLARMGELGFLGIRYPAEYGGSELDTLATVVLAEELGRSGVLERGGEHLAVVEHAGRAHRVHRVDRLGDDAGEQGPWVRGHALSLHPGGQARRVTVSPAR